MRTARQLHSTDQECLESLTRSELRLEYCAGVEVDRLQAGGALEA